MKRDSTIYIKDILKAMEQIEEFLGNQTLEELEKDDKTLSAIIRKFEVIGEATKSIPEKIKKEHPEIPWKSMTGMRDRLIHAYFGVDHEIVWSAIKTSIPLLKPKIRKILESQEKWKS